MKNFLNRLIVWIDSEILFFLRWLLNGFKTPTPMIVKRRLIKREHIPQSSWIETGTFKGSTTKFLGKFAQEVYSIEPSEKLYKIAKKNTCANHRIKLIFGTSERQLDTTVKKIKTKHLCFWLDGHYSSGMTYKGKKDTPIMHELSVIKKNIVNYEQILVLIDDIRLFGTKNFNHKHYPSKEFLIKWANDLKLSWKIEHDIFIAKTQ